MSATDQPQPRAVDGRYARKPHTEPALSLATADQPITSGVLRDWVTTRHRDGGTLAGTSLCLVDLSGMGLRGAALASADLWGADLDGADLTGADLAGCDLRSSSMQGTNLTGANLRGADLSGARFDDATTLTGALHDERTAWPAGFTPPALAVEHDLDA